MTPNVPTPWCTSCVYSFLLNEGRGGENDGIVAEVRGSSLLWLSHRERLKGDSPVGIEIVSPLLEEATWLRPDSGLSGLSYFS